jgi:hypothetical protein
MLAWNTANDPHLPIHADMTLGASPFGQTQARWIVSIKNLLPLAFALGDGVIFSSFHPNAPRIAFQEARRNKKLRP